MFLDLQLLIVINSIVLLKMLELIKEFITKLKHILQLISHDLPSIVKLWLSKL